MKPILFNTEMVRAILDGRKSVTRRVVKPQLPTTACVRKLHRGRVCDWIFWVDNEKVHTMKMPYRPGDIMYVRETFCECCLTENYSKGHSNYCYKASVKSPVYGCKNCYTEETGCKWSPSIHMPKEAARIFLRVTDVRVERLQEITPEQCITEGVDDDTALVRGKFSDLWDSIIKKADLPRYGWDASPWVWVIEFERIRKEALKNE